MYGPVRSITIPHIMYDHMREYLDIYWRDVKPGYHICIARKPYSLKHRVSGLQIKEDASCPYHHKHSPRTFMIYNDKRMLFMWRDEKIMYSIHNDTPITDQPRFSNVHWQGNNDLLIEYLISNEGSIHLRAIVNSLRH